MKRKNNLSVAYSMHTKLCFKIIVVGNKFAGKTSLIIRFVKDVFEFNYKVTVGVEFYSKIIQDGEDEIALQIWDTAGNQNYKSVVRSFYNFAHCVLIVYENMKDLNDSIENWMKEVKQNALEAVRLVLVRTKTDLIPMQQEEKQKVSQMVKKYSIDFYMAVSSKQNQNLFNKIGVHLHKLYKENEQFQKIVDYKNQSITLSQCPPMKIQRNGRNKKCCNN